MPIEESSAKPKDPGKALEGQAAIADLQIVDCLLPGQVRQLGMRTYLTPRRPVRTTAADCRLRGGEYVAYDRADYKSALKVWLPSAESGDPEAQTMVGEIFEQGLGGEPNYEAALIWYRKAAEQGYTRAQFNLGTLYEQGKGVPKNKLEALNWYRKAWGVALDDLIFASAASEEQEALRRELEQALAEKEQQLKVLNKRLEELEAAASSSKEGQSQAQSEARTLRTLVAQLEAQRSKQSEKLSGLPKTREPLVATPRSEIRSVDDQRVFKDMKLGHYYALLIGNDEYQKLDNLDSPLNDIARAKQILEQKYGFTVFVVPNGDNVEVMRAINDINEVVGENDNLLLFYAGHGSRLKAGDTEIGYWLPSNAEAPPRNTYWVPNEFVTGHLSRIKAKRILVVADSCYAGLLSSEPSFLLLGDNLPEYTDPEFMKFKLGKRSRLLLSSGGDQPVLDGGSGNHSIFASAFLDELEQNQGVLAGPQLFLEIRDKVKLAAEKNNFDQAPEFKAIKSAGHEVGDFFFVPIALQ